MFQLSQELTTPSFYLWEPPRRFLKEPHISAHNSAQVKFLQVFLKSDVEKRFFSKDSKTALGFEIMTSSSTIFFKRSFLCEIATIRVSIIKYQSNIFSQGFQNCPRNWNWSTGDRVMALPAPFFPALIFMSNRHHTSTFYKISINDFFPRIPKLPSDLKLVH